MATFKPIVRPYKRSDGTYRVYVRVTHNRAHKDIPTPFYVTSEQITRSFKLKDQYIIDKIEDKIRVYRDIFSRIGFVSDGLSLEHLTKLLENQSDKIDFIEYANTRVIAKLREEGREGSAYIYRNAFCSLKKFNGGRPLYFQDITQDYISEYFNSIKELKPNTQISYITRIKEVYKKAQKEFNDDSIGIIIVRHGVFDKIELPRRESSKDNVLRSKEDMQRIIDEPYWRSWSGHFAKDMFILSFVCCGTNMADWINMEKSQYKDGILYYRRHKTGRLSGDSVDIQIKVPEVGKIILEKYSGDPKYLIDFGQHLRKSSQCSYIHYYFAKAGLEPMPRRLHYIGKNKTGLTFNASRHSMASFARNICKVEYMTVHAMLNHATPSAYKTTDAYLWKDYSQIWEANEKLIALFDWSFYLNQKKQ